MLSFTIPLLLVAGIFLLSKAVFGIWEEWQLEKSKRKASSLDIEED